MKLCRACYEVALRYKNNHAPHKLNSDAKRLHDDDDAEKVDSSFKPKGIK